MQYCKTATEMSNPSSDDVRLSRLQRLQEKTSGFKQKLGTQSATSRKLVGNQNAKRKMKLVYLGWLFCSGPGRESKQIRQQNGGGRRKYNCSVDSLVSDLLVVSKTFFFPDDVNKFGHVSEFTFEMCSFDERVVPPDVTVEQIYARTGLEKLNLYMRSTRITPDDAEQDLFDLPDDSDDAVADVTQHSHDDHPLAVALAVAPDSHHDHLPDVAYVSDSEDFQCSSTYRSHVDAGTPTVIIIT